MAHAEVQSAEQVGRAAILDVALAPRRVEALRRICAPPVIR
jgi:hypothetical protein